MDYEIVTLEKKEVAGICARTNNMSPDMKAVIGALWHKFYGEGIYDAIPGKVSGKALGIYTEYAGSETDDYTIMTGCEIAEEVTGDIPPQLTVKIIPAGKYAKFVVKGDLHEEIGKFWEELCQMDLKRAFTADFEEYQSSDDANMEIHVYISLKEDV